MQPEKNKELLIMWGAFVLGFVSAFSQLFLVREFLSVFYGNELVIGIILFSWIFLSAIGTYLAIPICKYRLATNNMVVAGFLILAFFPMLSYGLLGWLCPLFLNQGQPAGLREIASIALLTLLPVCLLNGILFSLFCQAFKKRFYISRLYAYESIGALAGGVVIYFCAALFFNATHALFILGLLTILFCLILAFQLPIFKKAFIGCLFSLTILTLLAITDPGMQIQKNTFGNQSLLFQKNTYSGKLTVTQFAGQQRVYMNGSLWYSSGQSAFDQRIVHIVLSQRRKASNVLLIGGGISTVPAEILKYKPAQLVYTELVPELQEFCMAQNKILRTPAVVQYPGEIYNLLQNTEYSFSTVILNIPEPYSAAINRYYTTDFFYQVKRRLKPGGIILLSLPSVTNNFTGQAPQLQSTVYNTLKSQFQYVEILPGASYYFLASDEPISAKVAPPFQPKLFNTLFIPDHSPKDFMLDLNSRDLKNRLLLSNGEINTSLKPSSNLEQFTESIGHSGAISKIIIMLFLLFFLLYFYNLGRIGKSVFVAGFSCLGLELIIMVIYQSISGTIYRGSSIIISLFMLGMALGAMTKTHCLFNLKKTFSTILIILATLITAPLLLAGNPDYASKFNSFTLVALLILGFVFSLFTGILFSIGVSLGHGKTGKIVTATYGADMLGSSLGALLISSYLIPKIGVNMVTIFLSALLLFSGLALKIKK